MKTALITGISGQDGAYLAKLLLTKAYRVVGVVRKNREGAIKNLDYLGIKKSIVLKEIDLLDRLSVEELINEYQPDEFYN